MNRSKLQWLTPKELAAAIVIGVLTSLVDHQVQQLLLPFFAALQVQIHVFDYTGGPVIGDLLLVWLQYGGVLAAYLFRKPGSGTIAMTVNGFVQVYVNGIHAPHLLYGVSGLGTDLVFGAFRYKRYDIRIAALAGTASEVFWYPIVYFSHGVYLYPATFIFTDLVVRVLASSLGNGLLGAGIGFVILRIALQARARPSPAPVAGPAHDDRHNGKWYRVRQHRRRRAHRPGGPSARTPTSPQLAPCFDLRT